MKKILGAILICSFLTNCSLKQFSEPTTPPALTPDLTQASTTGQQDKPAHVAMLLPLTGKSASLGEALRNAGTLAQFDMAGNQFELSFHDTQGTPEGATQAYKEAMNLNPNIIIGPVFSAEAQAIQEEAPPIPVLTFTSDTLAVGGNVYTTALLIPEQVKELVNLSCQMGKRRLALLGPDDMRGTIVTETVQEAIRSCPGMEVVAQGLYPAGTTNFAPILLKMVPPPVDTRKKVLTPEEEARLATPIQDLLSFDSLLIFESGTALQQLVSLLAYYDVTPDVVPFLGLIGVGDISDKAFINMYFTGLPHKDYNEFQKRYQQTFKKQPLRLSSLAYDSVSLAAILSREGILNKRTLTSNSGYRGTDGLFRLNKDGSNNRVLEIFQVTGKGRFQTIKEAPSTFENKEEKIFVYDELEQEQNSSSLSEKRPSQNIETSVSSIYQESIQQGNSPSPDLNEQTSLSEEPTDFIIKNTQETEIIYLDN